MNDHLWGHNRGTFGHSRLHTGICRQGGSGRGSNKNPHELHKSEGTEQCCLDVLLIDVHWSSVAGLLHWQSRTAEISLGCSCPEAYVQMPQHTAMGCSWLRSGLPAMLEMPTGMLLITAEHKSLLQCYSPIHIHLPHLPWHGVQVQQFLRCH